MAKMCAIVLFNISCLVTLYIVPVISDDASPNPEIICRQPYISLDCDTTTEIWSYNSLKGICVQHNSCTTNNDNKFETKSACESTCSGILDAPYGDVIRVVLEDSDEQVRIQAYERMDTPDENIMDDI